jgi:hypothetical protein
MEFITQISAAKGYNEIMAMVDYFPKYTVFVSMKKTYGEKELAQMFFKHAVKYWGLPLNIVSDRDTRFTGNFWTALFKLVGMRLLMSSNFHQ